MYETHENIVVDADDQDVLPLDEFLRDDHIAPPEEDDLRKSFLLPRVNDFLQAPCFGDPSTYYRFGVIDFLQAYTRKKKLETLLLRKRFPKKPRDCFSCVEPNTYGDRFYEFLLKNLFTPVREFPEHELEKNDKEGLQEGSTQPKKKKKLLGLF